MAKWAAAGGEAKNGICTRYLSLSLSLTALSKTSILAPLWSNHRTDAVTPLLAASMSGVSICHQYHKGVRFKSVHVPKPAPANGVCRG